LSNDFFNFTRNVVDETVVMRGDSNTVEQLSFNVSVDKRLKSNKTSVRRRKMNSFSYDVCGRMISSYFFNFKTIGAGDV